MNLRIFLIDDFFRSGLPPEGSTCFYGDLSQASPRVRRPMPFYQLALVTPSCGSIWYFKDK